MVTIAVGFPRARVIAWEPLIIDVPQNIQSSYSQAHRISGTKRKNVFRQKHLNYIYMTIKSACLPPSVFLGGGHALPHGRASSPPSCTPTKSETKTCREPTLLPLWQEDQRHYKQLSTRFRLVLESLRNITNVTVTNAENP